MGSVADHENGALPGTGSLADRELLYWASGGGGSGSQGPQGATGAVGPQGAVGAQGATGTTGAAGPQGATGAAGGAGAAGAQGAVGPQGAAGAQGAQGAQGPSNISIYTTDGSGGYPVKPTWSSGLAGTQIYVKNDRGGIFQIAGGSGWEDAGAGRNETAPNTLAIDGIPVSGAHTAGYAPVIDVGGTTASWAPAGAGAQGPQGAAGAQGAAGPQGATGATGTTGAAGPQGAQGAQGSAGSGHTIQDLTSSFTARAGLKFLGTVTVVDNVGTNSTDVTITGTGAQGAQGAQGATGATGAQGAAGSSDIIGMLAADATKTSSTTLASLTAMSASLLATDKALFEIVIFYEAGTTGDIKVGLSALTGATGRWGLHGVDTATAAPGAGMIGSVKTKSDVLTATINAGGGAAGNAGMLIIKGVVVCDGTNAETLQVQFAQQTSDAVSTIAYAKSYLKVTKF